MFPPPQPWKQLQPVDPERTYLAFTSRFAMRSWLRVPAFIGATGPIQKQVEAAHGAIGYSLGAHLPSLYFYTLSVWEDDAALRKFSRALKHSDAMRAFHRDLRIASPFVRWSVRGSEVPLRWDDSLERIRAYEQEHRPASAT
jgi:hypothetical protein